MWNLKNFKLYFSFNYLSVLYKDDVDNLFNIVSTPTGLVMSPNKLVICMSLMKHYQNESMEQFLFYFVTHRIYFNWGEG